MKRLFTIQLISILLGCNLTKQEKPLADLNLYFDSETKIDSILVTNITQDREFHLMKYAKTINVDLNDSINDLYAINFFKDNDHRMVQLWLDGERPIIRGRVSENLKIQIDTVIGSNLYYKSIDFRKRYDQLLGEKPDPSAVNDFLINELKEEVNSPFSIEIANDFVHRNISDTNQLKAIFPILSSQQDAIKGHLLNPYNKIKTSLSNNTIDFSKYRFFDTGKKLTTITLSRDKKYLIDFWFIGCAPCIKDHKAIIKKLNVLEDEKVEVIGISVDNGHEQWTNFLKKNQYPWKNYREVDEHESRMRTKMAIDVYPTYLILDSNGSILYRSNAFAEIEKYLGI